MTPVSNSNMGLNQQLIEAAANGNLRGVKYLVRRGADIRAGDDNLVLVAAVNGHLPVVRYLHLNGADIRAYGWDGRDYAVRHAAENGHLNVVRYLYENGADISVQNDYGVRWAAANGHLEVVKYLHQHGADIWADIDCAMRYAAEKGHLKVVRYLLNPQSYGVNLPGYDQKILAQKFPQIWIKIQPALQALEQKELYNKARVMYYALTFAQQHKYSIGGCGALIQALNFGL